MLNARKYTRKHAEALKRTQKDAEGRGSTWKHEEAHGSTRKHAEARGSTQKHAEARGGTLRHAENNHSNFFFRSQYKSLLHVLRGGGVGGVRKSHSMDSLLLSKIQGPHGGVVLRNQILFKVKMNFKTEQKICDLYTI
jgi:hypothetical protein